MIGKVNTPLHRIVIAALTLKKEYSSHMNINFFTESQMLIANLWLHRSFECFRNMAMDTELQFQDWKRARNKSAALHFWDTRSTSRITTHQYSESSRWKPQYNFMDKIYFRHLGCQTKVTWPPPRGVFGKKIVTTFFSVLQRISQVKV